MKSGTGGATLVMKPENITLYQICMAEEPDALAKVVGVHSAPSPFCPVGRNISSGLDDTNEKLKEDMAFSMKAITMDKILADYHNTLNNYS